jgi:Fur family transcriptional regulator, ferric uptake regulator
MAATHTTQGDSATLAGMSMEQAREALSTAKLRRTSCRLAVLQHLSRMIGPVTHADVADKLVPEGYDKSTIYRCLIELADAGIANRLDLGDHVWRFELRGDETHKSIDHPHFTCVDCGKIMCLPDVKVDIGAPKNAKSTVTPFQVTEVLLKGHCGACN